MTYTIEHVRDTALNTYLSYTESTNRKQVRILEYTARKACSLRAIPFGRPCVSEVSRCLPVFARRTSLCVTPSPVHVRGEPLTPQLSCRLGQTAVDIIAKHDTVL